MAMAAAASPTVSPTPLLDAALCVALIGFFVLLSWPLWVGGLHATGIESFEWPPWHLARGYLIVSMLMCAFQLMLFSAIALTSPTHVAVGQLLVSPLSMLWDALELGYSLPPMAMAGTAAIVTAIAVVTLAAHSDAALLRLLVWLRGGRAQAGPLKWRELHEGGVSERGMERGDGVALAAVAPSLERRA